MTVYSSHPKTSIISANKTNQESFLRKDQPPMLKIYSLPNYINPEAFLKTVILSNLSGCLPK